MPGKNVPKPSALRGVRKAPPTVRPVDYTAVSELAQRRARGEHITIETLEAERMAQQVPASNSEATRPNPKQPGAKGAEHARGAGVGPGNSTRGQQSERYELVPPPSPGHPQALVTINPSDPRPYTRELTIIETEVRTVSGASLARITHHNIVLTVAEPDDTWTSDNGASDHYLRGPWTVQVRRSDNHVIGAFPSAYALAVKPENVQGSDPSDFLGPSNRRKQGTRHPGDQAALKRRLEEHGFVVSSSGATHGKVTHPEFPGLFTPWASTPSDRRHPQLVVAQVKRVFGIDIRG